MVTNKDKVSDMPVSDERIVFRSAYSPRLRVVSEFPGPSMTKQSFKDECDINTIMKRYERSGVLPYQNMHEPQFIDCTVYDYQEAMITVARAKSAFNEMPATLRERFENDPARLIEFLNDDKNRAEAIELGLVNPDVPPAPPVRVEVVPGASGAPTPVAS